MISDMSPHPAQALQPTDVCAIAQARGRPTLAQTLVNLGHSQSCRSQPNGPLLKDPPHLGHAVGRSVEELEGLDH